MNINTNHNFVAFDRQIDSTRTWLRSKVRDACGYSSEVIADRLMQRLIEICLPPFTLAVSELCKKKSSDLFPASGTRLNCGAAFTDIGSGRITVTPKQWLANQFGFLLHWTYCLFAIVSVKRTAAGEVPAVLIFGVADENIFVEGTDKRFADFCRAGPVEPLRMGRRLILESLSEAIPSSSPDIVYSKRPLIELVRGATLGGFRRFQLLVNHVFLFVTYMAAAVRLPQLSLLARDFAYSGVFIALDKQELVDSIVLTCSNVASQPLWTRSTRRAEVHMIWYAQNWKPIIYASDSVESDLPLLRWLRVDTHWVWTRAFADYLKALVHDSEINAVGPLVWYLPERIPPREDAIAIAVFDIPPFHDDVALRNGEISNYFHPGNLFSFIADVLTLRPGLQEYFGRPVSIRLKTKRRYTPIYDKAYFDHLETLAASGEILLEKSSANMYSMISSSHIAVAYPFTSCAYVADFMGVPSIYYDPTKGISRHDFRDSQSLISFANCPDQLLAVAIAQLKPAFSASCFS